MTGEIIVGMIGIVVMVIIVAYFSKPKQKEMTGAEKVAYETERGKILAQQEMGRRRW